MTVKKQFLIKIHKMAPEHLVAVGQHRRYVNEVCAPVFSAEDESSEKH